jgi:hypothetical protein
VSGRQVRFSVRNVGGTAGFGVHLRFVGYSEWHHLGDFGPTHVIEKTLETTGPTPIGQLIEVRYSLRTGETLEERWLCSVPIHLERKGIALVDVRIPV